MFKPHLKILDRKRLKLLPLFAAFKDRFYLAGGTALALQLAHRDSVDFDFFTSLKFNAEDLLREVKQVFNGYPVEVIQAGNQTLNLVVAGNIKVSFFCLKERLLEPVLNAEFLNLAGIKDIACMKISALLRASLKDYVDLYYIFKLLPLPDVLTACEKKYPRFEVAVYLKALVSLEDINQVEILFFRGKKIKLDQIKKDFIRRVKDYLRAQKLGQH